MSKLVAARTVIGCFSVALLLCAMPGAVACSFVAPSLDEYAQSRGGSTGFGASGAGESAAAGAMSAGGQVVAAGAAGQTAQAGNAGSGGQTAQAGNGGQVAGSGGASPLTCPTSAPFPDTTPKECTQVVYVAAGLAIRRIVSFDGKAWINEILDPQDGQNQNQHQITSVAIGKGVIVATGDGGLLVSTDAKNWTQVQSLPADLYSSQVAYALGQFELVGGGGTWTSVDGMTWNGATGKQLVAGSKVSSAFSDDVHGVAVSGDRVVFIGDNSAVRVFDGSTWQDATVGNYNGWLSSVAYGSGRFVVTGDACCGASAPTSAGLRAWSGDGLVWQDVTTNATAGADQLRFGSLLWTGSQFLSTSTVYGTDGLTSPDGVTWSYVTFNATIGPACKFDGGYLGSDGTSLYTSSDAVHWVRSLQGNAADWFLGALAVGRVLK